MANLTAKESRIFSRQMNVPDVGQEKQERLKDVGVAVVGLCGIGVTASRYLCNAGYGKVVMIDQSLINEDSLASMTYVGWDDVGKHRCIAVRERMLATHPYYDDKLDIYNTLPKADNVDKLFEGCDIILDTCRGYESSMSILDYADKNNVPVIVAAGRRWIGFVGIYTGKDKETLRSTLKKAYENEEICMCRKFCFGFLNGAMGSIAVGWLTRMIWGMEEDRCTLAEYDFRGGKINSLLGEEDRTL